MRFYASAYEMTMKSSSWENCNLTNFPKDFIAHKNVAYATIYNGVIIKTLKAPCKFSPAFKPSEEMLLRAIIKDALGRNDSIDKMLVNALIPKYA